MFDSYDMKSLWFEFVNLLKTGNSTLRTCHFEASEKSKSQESNTEKGVLSRPLEIGILLHKQNIHAKHFVPECYVWSKFCWLGSPIIQLFKMWLHILELMNISISRAVHKWHYHFFSDILIPLFPKSKLFYIYENRFYTDI